MKLIALFCGLIFVLQDVLTKPFTILSEFVLIALTILSVHYYKKKDNTDRFIKFLYLGYNITCCIIIFFRIMFAKYKLFPYDTKIMTFIFSLIIFIELIAKEIKSRRK